MIKYIYVHESDKKVIKNFNFIISPKDFTEKTKYHETQFKASTPIGLTKAYKLVYEILAKITLYVY